MKKIKLVLFFMAIGLIIFNGCKKDDEKLTTSGYFTVDGKKYELDMVYYEYFDIEDDPYSDDEFLQHAVYFTSKDIIVKNREDISGKGGIVLLQYMDPLKQQIPAPGEYVYQMDAMPVKSYTYFDFSIVYADYANTSAGFFLQIRDATVKETKTEDVYEFSSTGKTTEGKDFEFYYKGIILPMPE